MGAGTFNGWRGSNLRGFSLGATLGQQQLQPFEPDAAGRAEQAVVAHLVRPFGQDVLQEPPQELLGGECHQVGRAGGAFLPAKGNLAILQLEDTPVGDGDAVHVAAEIGQHLAGAVESRLGVDDPFPVAVGGTLLAGQQLPSTVQKLAAKQP